MTSENQSSDGDGPRVVYVPGDPSFNVYHRGYDAVILDEALGDHPRAHYLIKEHELEHARQNRDPDAGFLEHLRHEFKTDWLIYVSPSEDAQYIREYLNDNPFETRRRERIAHELTNVLRACWTLLLLPIGFVNRLYGRLTERDTQ